MVVSWKITNNLNMTQKKDKKLNNFSFREDCLNFHSRHPAGKIAIDLTKPLNNQLDLSLAYSPGVSFPCLEIHEDPSKDFLYTAKGNFVAVISNGTAVLGLGNLGAAASKPVMEGKVALFKRFADIDAIDVEVSTEDPEEFINAVKLIGRTWGGINLEDIKAPECFIIEDKLKKLLDVPVFHDDQHGTAIITGAALINAAEIQGKKLEDLKVVASGAGAASIACMNLIKGLGVKPENIIMCDTKGPIYKGRTEGMNKWKEEQAVETNARTLAEAMVGADVFIGVSVKGTVTGEMVASMAEKPIIFAMANPDPEITPDEVLAVRDDAIIATGRSDYDNQVNNVMGFPYIFRGALDVQAKTINEKMKIAATRAIASLAKEDVPYEVSAAYSGRRLKFGANYIIPTPFDPRLIYVVPKAVAKAAMDSGVARKPIIDFDVYHKQLASRLNPTYNLMNLFLEELKHKPKRMIFAEGDDEQMIRAAVQWRNNGYGTPILVGHVDFIKKKLQLLGTCEEGLEINNAAINPNTKQYIDDLYQLLQRKGFLQRDCARMVKRDRNIFASLMLNAGEGDGMITGSSRHYLSVLDDVRKVIKREGKKRIFGISVLVIKERTIFIADTTINESPTAEELVEIAIQSATEARKMGHTPRVAFLSFSNFGNPLKEKADFVRDAVKIMNSRSDIDFEYEGEMQADVALNEVLLSKYPFSRLSGPANVLIMPGLHSANISSKLLKELSGGMLIGPILCGLERPVQIVNIDSRESDILNLAAICVHRRDA
ncbi:MAG: bifunctional malic enzyme oxidoreductase/phosphotransacetylase [Candidatus Midichloriaceae bacterium]|jgi:malate dehydrogenase (oxaloacetate-decarboxylating)(NADP+)|nr:bifunctional malic enzyme oxidoreductase/phosphotransacetylase [Candidatus Midichloriaceae bacterium]